MVLLRFAGPPPGAVDRDMVEGNKYAARSGRSWWGVRYTDGHVVHEWEPNPFSPNGHQDWILLPKEGLQKLRLYCPNQKCAEVGGAVDATGRLFQLKQAVVSIGMGGASGGETLCHIIGAIEGVDGTAHCFRWEPYPAPVPPNEADYTTDRSRLGALADAYDAYRREYAAWRKAGCGRGPIEWRDNVLKMEYGNIGALSAENLALVVGEGR